MSVSSNDHHFGLRFGLGIEYLPRDQAEREQTHTKHKLATIMCVHRHQNSEYEV